MQLKQFLQQKMGALMGLMLVLLCTLVKAQTIRSSASTSEKKYKARMAKQPIKVDGKLNEHSWKQAVLISDFEDIEGANKPKPTFSTTVKMMWDSQYLYIGAVLEEPHLWGTLKKHDDIIYRDHDFEVFIDPMGDGEQYFEIEINVLGTIMDLFMNKPYKKGGTFDMEWNTTGIQSKIIANILPTVKLNGHLLFVTCSVYKDENEKNVEALIATGKFKVVKQQYFTGYDQQADTLFGALLEKITA